MQSTAYLPAIDAARPYPLIDLYLLLLSRASNFTILKNFLNSDPTFFFEGRDYVVFLHLYILDLSQLLPINLLRIRAATLHLLSTIFKRSRFLIIIQFVPRPNKRIFETLCYQSLYLHLQEHHIIW